MTAPVCPVDGHPYTDHPPGDPAPARYRLLRRALFTALAHTIYWPGISDAHRAAIARARQERQVQPWNG